MDKVKARKVYLPAHCYKKVGNKWIHSIKPGTVLVFQRDLDVLAKLEACHCLTQGDKEYLRSSLIALNSKENKNLDLTQSYAKGNIYDES